MVSQNHFVLDVNQNCNQNFSKQIKTLYNTFVNTMYCTSSFGNLTKTLETLSNRTAFFLKNVAIHRVTIYRSTGGAGPLKYM